MEKIALIGDTHFSRKAEHPLIKKHIKDGQLEFFDFVIETLTKQNIKTVLFTGDIHDTRQSINVDALINTKRLFQEKMKDFDIHIILGNHDMYYENSYETTSLELFEDIPNVTVYRNGIQKQNFLGKTWYMVPWIIEENQEKFVKFLDKLAKNPKEKIKDTVFFGHFEMFGINMEGNNLSTFGLDPNLFINAAGLTLSGHYHGLSETTKGDNTVLYLGSPYPMTFANANQAHGIWILDENMQYDFIENKISPDFRDIWDIDNLDKLPDLSNSFVRLYINNDNSEEKDFEIRLKVENKKPILIRPMPYKGNRNEIEEKNEHEREANRILKMDTLSLSEIYLDQNNDALPQLRLNSDPKKAILEKLLSYKETINS